MKLILCKNCQDVVRLMQDDERFCKCGKCSGKYTDDLNAWYKGGEFVVPLGFANSSLVRSIHNQPKEGWGEKFTAFVIPESCDTFKQCDIHVVSKPFYCGADENHNAGRCKNQCRLCSIDEEKK